MTVQETAKNLLAAEIAHGCTERRTGGAWIAYYST